MAPKQIRVPGGVQYSTGWHQEVQMPKIRVLFVLAATAFIAAACMKSSTPSDSSATPAPPAGKEGAARGTQEADWAAILKLEEQAKGMAKTTGCSSSTGCRSAPVGSKGCGGPRYYIPWCAKSTDSAALYSKLDEIVSSEKAYNKKYNVISTCEYRVAPTVGLVAGTCTAQ
jgi:hypothetical protein